MGMKLQDEVADWVGDMVPRDRRGSHVREASSIAEE